MDEPLHKFLTGIRTELQIRQKKLKKFEQEVAVNNVVYAISEALKEIKKNKGEN